MTKDWTSNFMNLKVDAEFFLEETKIRPIYC